MAGGRVLVEIIQSGRSYRQFSGFIGPDVRWDELLGTGLDDGSRRSFLFLQGNVSQFFQHLGAALADRGHSIHKVNFNGGDQLFWRLPGAINFHGKFEEWPAYFESLLVKHEITDVILFGDCRPVHRPAIIAAKERHIQVYVLEEGYLRPNWITLERGGVNGFTTLPRLPEDFIRLADRLPEIKDGSPIENSFARRAAEDVLYHLVRLLMHWRFPHYKFHAPVDPFIEYWGWVKRFVMRRFKQADFSSVYARTKTDQPYYLFPLQLDSDYQVRVHSKFKRIQPALEQVVRSFSKCAPADSMLMVKSHPLDSGLCDWKALVAELAAKYNTADRVFYIEHDDLIGLVKRARGVVTINSTVGSLALQFKRPLVALGQAIYDVEGLTFQFSLNRFWKEALPPQPEVFAAFQRVLVHHCLVRGSFFSRKGVACAVEAAVQRIDGDAVKGAEQYSVTKAAYASVT
jgi:capsular polysaccharide export protein